MRVLTSENAQEFVNNNPVVRRGSEETTQKAAEAATTVAEKIQPQMTEITVPIDSVDLFKNIEEITESLQTVCDLML